MGGRGTPVRVRLAIVAGVVVVLFGTACSPRTVEGEPTASGQSSSSEATTTGTGPASTENGSETVDALLPIRELPTADLPDDLRYVFQRRMPDGEENGPWEIALGSSTGDFVPILQSDRDWLYTKPSVSPDGKYISVLGRSLATESRGDQAIFLAETSDLADFGWVPTGLRRFTCADWAPDSDSIVVSRQVAPGEWRVSSVDVRSGLISDLWDESYGSDDVPCGKLIDARTFVYYVRNKETGDVGVWQRDLETSQVESVIEMVDCFTVNPVQRPGTDEVAVINNCIDDQLNGLWLVSLTDSSVRRVLNGLVGGQTWSPDGEWLLFAHQLASAGTEDDHQGTDLWIARADGSEATKLHGAIAAWPSWIPAEVDCPLCQGSSGQNVASRTPLNRPDSQRGLQAP